MNTKPVYRGFLDGQPWCITPEGLTAFAQTFEYRAPAAVKEGKDFFGNDRPRLEIRGGVALVPIRGPLVRSAGFLEKGFGAMAHGEISAMIEQAVKIPGVRSIALMIDSPGGTHSGTPELADAVREADRRKPVTAYVEGMAASAAYWVASAARTIVASPSAMVGSVGVILQTVQIGALLNRVGYQVNLFTSGAMKAAGHPMGSMSKDHASYLQGTVDTLGREFADYVAGRRPGASRKLMDGRVMPAAEGRAAGFVDRIAASPFASPSREDMNLAEARANGDWAKAWELDPALKAEFSSAENCAAYHRAVETGRTPA